MAKNNALNVISILIQLFFTSQTGRVLKTCASCWEQAATIYRTHHPNKKFNEDQLEHLYWNDIKKKLHDKIIEIGDNEYLENKEMVFFFLVYL